MKNIEQDVFNTIIKITSDMSDQDSSKKININTSISDAYNLLPLDSLDVVEFVMEVEKEFNITIPDEDAAKLEKVGDAVKYIDAHRK